MCVCVSLCVFVYVHYFGIEFVLQALHAFDEYRDVSTIAIYVYFTLSLQLADQMKIHAIRINSILCVCTCVRACERVHVRACV